MTRKVIERVLKVPVGIFLKITQDARVELLFIQRRLQVDGQAVAVLREVAHMRACRQDQRAGDTEMREEHLAEVGIDLLIVLIIDRESPASRRTKGHWIPAARARRAAA